MRLHRLSFFTFNTHRTKHIQISCILASFRHFTLFFYYSQNILIYIYCIFAFVSPLAYVSFLRFSVHIFLVFLVFLKKYRFFTITKVPGNHIFCFVSTFGRILVHFSFSVPHSVYFWHFLVFSWFSKHFLLQTNSFFAAIRKKTPFFTDNSQIQHAVFDSFYKKSILNWRKKEVYHVNLLISTKKQHTNL